MPRRITTILGMLFGASVAFYIALVVFTVTLATWQTELASSVGDTEASIGALETKYYASVAAMTSEDPGELGFVVPANTAYAHSTGAPVLTRAGF